MKLISMTDFVISLDSTEHWSENYAKCVKYANFLKQPLELWMFIPCDEYGNILEKPILENMPFCSVNGEGYDYAILKYQQAKERCLFEGYQFKKETETYFIFLQNKWEKSIPKNCKIEDLIGRGFDLQLTQTAIKQIRL